MGIKSSIKKAAGGVRNMVGGVREGLSNMNRTFKDVTGTNVGDWILPVYGAAKAGTNVASMFSGMFQTPDMSLPESSTGPTYLAASNYSDGQTSTNLRRRTGKSFATSGGALGSGSLATSGIRNQLG